MSATPEMDPVLKRYISPEELIFAQTNEDMK
jgi:hypothetical protein